MGLQSPIVTLGRTSVMWYDELAMRDGVFMKVIC